jgi:cellulose synthase/poly-beta-1,6-N-acetylglucosamine synthase-like glycosyltransferase
VPPTAVRNRRGAFLAPADDGAGEWHAQQPMYRRRPGEVTALDYLAATGLMLIIWAWLVYPLLIAAFGALRRPARGARVRSNPGVSIVIASRDSADAIRARVENCLDSDYDADKLEVVVALDGNGEAAWAVADLPGVRVVHADSPGGKACALNAGVRAAAGTILVFADTHQRFDRRTIPHLVTPLLQPEVGAVSGRLDIPGGRALLSRLYWRYERWLRWREARVHSTVGVSGSVWAMRRELWQPLPADLLLDDLYTPMRIALSGLRIEFAESARAVEVRRSEPSSEYRRKVRTLTGVIQVVAWLPAVLVPWRNPIWAQFIAHKLLRMFTPVALLPIVLWALWTAAITAPHVLVALLIGVGMAGAWLVRSRHHRARLARDIIVEGTLLQAAILVASANGLRGRWDVWHG